MSGRFVTVEGCEGVGKSTLIAGLKEYFAREGYDAAFTREPGGTPAAERIRSIILDPDCPVTPHAELMLYAAARAQHTEELILPALRAGKIVVCDRYSDSTLAYQGYARGLGAEVCERLSALSERGAKIDLTLFLDLSPEKGFARKGGADKGDRLEKESLDFHMRVYEGFREIARRNPRRVVSIDASRGADEVLSLSIAAMKERGIVHG